MKFSTAVAAFFAIPFALTSAVSVSYDNIYDNPNQSLSTVACSDGSSGLLTKGYTTFGSLKNFPNIGGVPAVTGWNSASCGTCWKLTYTNSKGVANSINILAVDSATPDFNIGVQALNTLTGGQAIQLGRVPITATQVAASVCKL